MARNPYERRRGPHDHDLFGSFHRGGMVAGDGGPQRSTVEFEDLEAMVGQAAARGRRQAAEFAREREHEARREAWAEGHTIGMSDGRVEVREAFDERFSGEVLAAVKATRDLLADYERDARRVPKSDLADRCSRLVNLLVSVSMDATGREA